MVDESSAVMARMPGRRPILRPSAAHATINEDGMNRVLDHSKSGVSVVLRQTYEARPWGSSPRSSGIAG